MTIQTYKARTKDFKVIRRSLKSNSFGLHCHLLISRKGQVWEVLRSVGPWNPDWTPGTVVKLRLKSDGIDPIFDSCECPLRFIDAPAKVVRELWKK